MDDLFLKIIAREIPADIVYEDEHTLAFLDIKPVAPGHTLVIPKTKSRTILEAGSEDGARLMQSIQKVARAVKTATNADGINIIMNSEPAAGQIIFHTHAHIIPRFENDGLQHWPQHDYENDQIKKEVAEKIKRFVISR